MLDAIVLMHWKHDYKILQEDYKRVCDENKMLKQQMVQGCERVCFSKKMLFQDETLLQDGNFVCERVDFSKKLLQKVRPASKDSPHSETSIIACGVSQVDAFVDACASIVCGIDNPVLDENNVCLRRCKEESLRFSAKK
ncbi:hypothetical protein Tsubulata_038524 [Turnera subulata]|uniref:Uncharacterized protein n=1 Tax=Turnera subulata TaxID=218843 RepID=A0A9Q0FLL5_9ROSI|nr:hypothetical protein Tsubulata_038524 [Turnera subulata]